MSEVTYKNRFPVEMKIIAEGKITDLETAVNAYLQHETETWIIYGAPFYGGGSFYVCMTRMEGVTGG